MKSMQVLLNIFNEIILLCPDEHEPLDEWELRSSFDHIKKQAAIGVINAQILITRQEKERHDRVTSP